MTIDPAIVNAAKLRARLLPTSARQLLHRLLVITSLLLSQLTFATEPAEVHIKRTLKINISELLPLLEQPCHVQRWMPNIIEIELIERPSDHQQLVYMATKTPWPFAPRDAITLFERNGQGPVTIQMSSMPTKHPPRPGYVRIPYSEGQWILTSAPTLPDNNRTLLIYRQRVHPGGRVPLWLANQAAKAQATRTLDGLESYVNSYTEGSITAGCPALERNAYGNRASNEDSNGASHAR